MTHKLVGTQTVTKVRIRWSHKEGKSVTVEKTGDVSITIDYDRLFQILGGKALFNVSGKAVEMSGIITAHVVK